MISNLIPHKWNVQENKVVFYKDSGLCIEMKIIAVVLFIWF